MKSKHKILPSTIRQVETPPIQYRTINKRHRQFEQKNHFPISSTQFTISQQNEERMNSSNLKRHGNNKQNRSSPYMHLPSLGSESKSFRMNSSKMSDGYQRNNESIYDQITGSSGRSVNEHSSYNNSTMMNRPEEYYSTRHTPTSHNNASLNQSKNNNLNSSNSHINFSKRQNQPMQCYYAQNSIIQQQQDYGYIKNTPSQHQIQKQINDKLDRVCEKIDNLSKSKQKDHHNRKCQKHKNDRSSRRSTKENLYHEANTNASFSTSAKLQWIQSNQPTPKTSQKLCYSSIVYQPSTQLSRTVSSGISNFPTQQLLRQQFYKQTDNNIHHRILSPSKPTMIEIQEIKIIQLEKKITLQAGRVMKLEEELLKNNENIIKKEKEWLLRENQLLNWIEDNEKELEQYKLQAIDSVESSIQEPFYTQAQNVIVQHKSGRKHIKYSEYSASKSNNNRQQNSQSKLTDAKGKEVKVDDKLIEMMNDVIKMIKMNESWIALMSRTLSEELPGTAFRVKEEMNLNKKFINQLYDQCTRRLSSIDSNPINNPYPKNLHSQPLFTNESDIFLLQSYCPPTSERYQISTRRNHSSIKQSSRKSLCVSETKSTTTKKNHLTETQKKNTKSKQNIHQQKRQVEFMKPRKSLNKSFCQQRQNEEEYFCDEVFHAKNSIVQDNLTFKLSNSTEQDFYYFMSLQAMALEEFINPFVKNIEDTYEEDLLGDEDSQLLERDL